MKKSERMPSIVGVDVLNFRFLLRPLAQSIIADLEDDPSHWSSIHPSNSRPSLFFSISRFFSLVLAATFAHQILLFPFFLLPKMVQLLFWSSFAQKSSTFLSIIFLFSHFLANFVCAEFSEHFGQWLAKHFGEDIRINLERKDLGVVGSFGGRNTPDEPITHQPVIFVHGVSNRAWDKMKHSADFFQQHGYSYAELYGTTYANGDQGNPLQWSQYAMKCHYVKLVRALIVAVRLYTGRQVDVIGYSLGVPVSRKAILGGQCVDTGEQLGAPLTKFVDTYIGVAGPNHGISLQFGLLSLPGCALALLPVCNTQTGLFSGFCPSESAFLQDINRQSGFEGQHRFSIYSLKDQWIGHTVCGKVTGQVPWQNGEKILDNANHDEVFLNTFPIQMEMAINHIVP